MRIADIAAKKVKVTRAGRKALQCDLRLTPHWRPARDKRYPSVGPESVEALQAGPALVRRVKDELRGSAVRLPLADWITREAQRAGSIPKLAARLLTIPASAVKSLAGADRTNYKALIRSLQRAAPAKKAGRKQSHVSIKSPKYQRLIADYAGGESGNPFAPLDVVGMARLAEAQIDMGIIGDWQISNQLKIYHPWNTGLRPAQTPLEERLSVSDFSPYEVIAGDGAAFIAYVEGTYQDTIGPRADVVPLAYYNFRISILFVNGTSHK